MKKQILPLLIGVSLFANAQVDTLSFSNFRPWYYSGFWPEPDIIGFVLHHSDTDSCLLGFSDHLEAVYHLHHNTQMLEIKYYHLSDDRPRRVIMGLHSGDTLTIQGIAKAWSRTFARGALATTTMANVPSLFAYYSANGYTHLSLSLLDSAKNTLASASVPLADSLANGVFNTRFEVSPLNSHHVDSILYLYEALFDAPVCVVDSFFVEARLFNPSLDSSISLPLECLLEQHHSIYFGPIGQHHRTQSSEYFYPPFSWYDMKGWRAISPSSLGLTEMPDNVWSPLTNTYNETPHGIPMVFPILANTCKSPDNVQVEAIGRIAKLSWIPGRCDHSWQISYGPAGTTPENGSFALCNTPFKYISDIPLDRHYVAYLRSFCIAPDSLWGDWGDSIHIFLPSSNNIASATDLGIRISPNPAASRALISSHNTQLRSLNVFNSAGIPVAQLQLSGHNASLDTSAWPDGLYLLLLHTDLGPASASLLVKH